VEASSAVGNGGKVAVSAGSAVGEAVASGVVTTALFEQAAVISASMGGSTLKMIFLNIILPDGGCVQAEAFPHFNTLHFTSNLGV
jgi:hypothetical protein